MFCETKTFVCISQLPTLRTVQKKHCIINIITCQTGLLHLLKLYAENTTLICLALKASLSNLGH